MALGAEVGLSSAAAGRIGAARDVIDRAVASNETVYGVTTGFGSLANRRIEQDLADALQLGIVRSHATAVGPPLSREARAMLLLRAHVLALGHSGVRAGVVERMVEMLNRDLIPVVPEQGSLGASGTCSTAREPRAPARRPRRAARRRYTSARRRRPSGPRARTAPAQGQGGTRPRQRDAGRIAIGILAVAGADRLVRTADVTAAMSVEAALGSDRVFDERLTALARTRAWSPPRQTSRRLLEGSAIVASHRDGTHLVQDAYSLRCSPQVSGATRECSGSSRRPRGRGERGLGQPDRAAGRRRGATRVGTSTANQSRSRSTRSQLRSSRSRASPSGGSTGCSIRRGTTGYRRSWSPRAA